MKLIILISISLVAFSKCWSQTTPAQWLGQWQGELEIYNYQQAQPEKVTMQMNIEAISDSTWRWETTYVAGDKVISEKNYRLVTIDAAAGLYQVDEMNGIQLQAQMLGNRLITFFEAGNNLLTISYFMHQNQLHFEVYFADNKSKVKTGGTSEDVPIVLTYRTSTYQQAVFSKLEK